MFPSKPEPEKGQSCSKNRNSKVMRRFRAFQPLFSHDGGNAEVLG